MRIENIREVKARLNRLVGELPEKGSIVVTRNGKPCAVLMPFTEDTDLEAIALAQNRAFWATYDAALEEAEREGWVTLQAVRAGRTRAARPKRQRSARRRKRRAARSK